MASKDIAMGLVDVRDPLKEEYPSSAKIAFLIDDTVSRKTLKLFLLFGDNNTTKELFSLNNEEIEEIKKKIFNPDNLVKLGRHYIRRYLSSQNELDLLAYYDLGKEYCKKKFGMVDLLSSEEESILMKKLLQKTLEEGLVSDDLLLKIKCIKVVGNSVIPKEKNMMDEISELFKDIIL